MSSSSKNNKILIAIMIGYSVIYMDKQLISLAIIPLSNELSLTAGQIGDIMAFYFIGYSVMQIPGGYLSDKIGARKVLLLSLIIAIVSSMFYSTISVVGLLAATRLVLGLGHAGYPSSATKTISNNFPAEKRVFAQSMILSTSGIGGILAALLGSTLISNGWRTAYIALAVLYALSFVIVFLFVPKDKEKTTAEKAEKVNLKEAFKDTNVYVLFIALLSVNIVLFGVMSWLPTYLTKELSVSSSSIAAIVGVNAIVTVASIILTGTQLGKALKNKEKPFVLITSLAVAALLILFVSTNSVPLALGLLVTLTAFAVAGFTTLFTLPHKIFSPKIIGITFGMVSTGGTLGGFVANKVIGSLVESSGGYFTSFMFMAIASVVTGVSILLIKKRDNI